MSNTPLHIPDLINIGKWIDYRDPIWGDSYNWSWNRTPEEVRYLVIHHTATAHDATPDDIALLHKARGWGGIGYHFVITKDGTVYYVGDVGTARANVLNMNEKVIGIALVGNFTKHLPSDEQIVSAHYLCKFFLGNKNIWKGLIDWDSSVEGHKEFQPTACPGNDWKETSSSLFNRIKDKVPYTPQHTTKPVEPSIDWESDYKHLEKQFNEYKDIANKKIKLLVDIITNLGATEENVISIITQLKDFSKELKELKTQTDEQKNVSKPLLEMYTNIELVSVLLKRLLFFLKNK